MEGCGYRDLFVEFEALGVQIVGVGFGPTVANASWVQSEGFQYEVWNDLNKTLSLHYGAVSSPLEFIPQRITRLLDSDGTLIVEYNNVQVNGHPQQVLDDCKAIFGDQ